MPQPQELSSSAEPLAWSFFLSRASLHTLRCFKDLPSDLKTLRKLIEHATDHPIPRPFEAPT